MLGLGHYQYLLLFDSLSFILLNLLLETLIAVDIIMFDLSILFFIYFLDVWFSHPQLTVLILHRILD